MRSSWMLLLAACGASAPEATKADAAVGGNAERARAPGASAKQSAAVEMDLEDEAIVRAEPMDKAKPAPPSDDPAEDASAAVRAWFPDAFLWSPEVVTDDRGSAVVQVPIPDTLTEWRMLGLSHDRQGRQAGEVLSVRGAMPTWIELRVPAWLTEGDEVGLPLQVFHQGKDRLSSTVDVSWTGAGKGSLTRSMALATGDRILERLPIPVEAAGALVVDARLGALDAVQKTIPVRAAGRPLSAARAGLLTRPLVATLREPVDAIGDGVIDAWVHAGALSLLQAELERLAGGGGPWEGAYGQALALHLEELAASVGAEVDAETLRRVRLLAWQRVRGDSVTTDAGVAAHLLRGLGTPRGKLEQQAQDRLVRTVRAAQRGDGTWAGSDTSLAAVLVKTAAVGGSLPDDDAGRARAAGALERLGRSIDDPFVAAVALSSGLMTGDTSALVTMVRDAVTIDPDGRARFAVGSGARSVWWGTPSQREALAWAALALKGEDETRHGAAVATLIEGYDAMRGFGAAMADSAVLRAVADALPAAQQSVTVRLLLDGEEAARGTLDPRQPFTPARLVVDVPSGVKRAELVADPPIPGLAAGLVHTVRVPWADVEPPAGVTFEVDVPELRVGSPGTVRVTLAGPSTRRLSARIGLPPGVEASPVEASNLTATVLGDSVMLETGPLRTGEVIEAEITVRAAFAGRLHSAPHGVGYTGSELVAQPPDSWWIR